MGRCRLGNSSGWMIELLAMRREIKTRNLETLIFCHGQWADNTCDSSFIWLCDNVRDPETHNTCMSQVHRTYPNADVAMVAFLSQST